MGVTFRNSCANVYFSRAQLRAAELRVIFNQASSSVEPGSAELGNKCSVPWGCASWPSAGSVLLTPLGPCSSRLSVHWDCQRGD